MQTITQRYPQGVVLPADNTRAVLEVYGGTVNGLPTPYRPRVVPTGELTITGDSVVHTNQVPLMLNELYVARLDGAVRYWELSAAIVVSAASTVTIEADVVPSIPPEDNTTICCSTAAGTTLWVYARLNNFITVKVNGDFRSFDFPEPIRGKVQIDITAESVSVTHQEITKSAGINPKPILDISYLASRSGSSAFLAGYIKDFEVTIDGVLEHSIPLTNKDQGAIQLATVGSVNAEMIGYTGDEWENIA